MTPLPIRTLLRALAAAGTATVATVFVYAAIQQSYRTGADDPQVQMAEDAAVALRAGRPAETVVPRDTVDLARSLRPFVIVYDRDDRPIAGSGRLDGALPVPPAGVLDRARLSGDHGVTWQPRRGVRIASVLHAAGEDGRVVLAGRSLREIEVREARLRVMSALAWGALLVGSVAAALL